MDDPKFTDEQKQRLAEYVKRGGMLLAVAACDRPQLVAAVKRLGKELWPKLAWQKLPDDHAVYTRKSHFGLAKRPELWGLTGEDGFTFFVLSPTDLGCLWHHNLRMTREQAFQLAVNLYRYALRGKPIRARPAS